MCHSCGERERESWCQAKFEHRLKESKGMDLVHPILTFLMPSKSQNVPDPIVKEEESQRGFDLDAPPSRPPSI